MLAAQQQRQSSSRVRSIRVTSYNDLVVVVVRTYCMECTSHFRSVEHRTNSAMGMPASIICQRVSVYDNEYHCGREQYFVQMSCCEDRCSKLWAWFARTMEAANPICCSGNICSTRIRIQRGSEYVSASHSNLID